MTCDIYPTLIAKLGAQEFSRSVNGLGHKKLSYTLLPQNCPKKAQKRSCQQTFLRYRRRFGLGPMTAKGKSRPTFRQLAADQGVAMRGIDRRYAGTIPREQPR